MKTASVVMFLASSAFAQNPALVPHAQPACGAANVEFQTKPDASQRPDPQLEAGKALIYVMEDQKFKFVRDITVRIGLDGAWVGATRGSSYLFFSVEPGEHHLCADWMSNFAGRLVSLFGLTAEAGKVYYFRARTMASPINSSNDKTALIDLDLVNSDEGKLLVASSPLSVSHPKK
jgi:uncharacterized protein DUF2846